MKYLKLVDSDNNKYLEVRHEGNLTGDVEIVVGDLISNSDKEYVVLNHEDVDDLIADLIAINLIIKRNLG